MINTVNDDKNILQNCNQFIYLIAERVYKELGSGHTEFIYHRAMETELRSRCVNHETEKRVLISYKTEDGIEYSLGEERIDLFIPNENIIIELKAMVTPPKETEITQVYKYYRELRKVGIQSKYGVIINFPQSGVKIAKDSIDFCEIIF